MCPSQVDAPLSQPRFAKERGARGTRQSAIENKPNKKPGQMAGLKISR